jgi:probable F420-dependent oxidoreductase
MPLREVAAHARRAEMLGCDGLLVPEAVQDAILCAALALEHTGRLQVATGVVVAFARSPTLLAQDAWALAQLSGGRFELGLGPQVRGNVERRFGMPWSAPAARMRDYVGAVRAVWDCWQDGGELAYESASYTLTRMQPFFRPEPLEGVLPRILLGAIGPHMTRVAGEVADTLLTHPTNSTPAFVRDVVRPALAEGAGAAGREADAVRIIAGPMVATGSTEEEVAAEREEARQVLAFTYSTPAYRATLEHHGWADVADRLRESVRSGSWAEMNGLITGEMLDVLVPSAPYAEIAGVLTDRYAGSVDAVTLRLPRSPASEGDFAAAVASIRGHDK